MKTRKLFGIVIAIALMICAFAAITIANAQECIWDLYVDGKPYDSNASYATSGQVKWAGGNATVYLNNFTGKSLVAIPGGNYGDDDAPYLSVVISGENKLTGSYMTDGNVFASKPSSGKYWLGALYAEPRYGGFGANSKVRISGKGSLNISISNSLTTREDITAVVAGDSFTVSGNAKVAINYGGFGVKDSRLLAVDTPAINVTDSAILEVSAKADTTVVKGTLLKSDCSVEAFGEASVTVNTLGYLSTDIRTQNMGTTDPVCNDITVDKNSALYIAVPESTGYTMDGISVSDKMNVYIAETSSWKYRTYTPLTIPSSSLLKPVSWNEVFANTDYPKYGDAKTAAVFADKKSTAHCYLLLEGEKYTNGYTGGSGGTTDSFSKYDGLFKFTHTVVPAPGYYVNAGVTTSNLKYASPYPISKSATNAVNVVYSYTKLEITQQPTAYLCGAANDGKDPVLEIKTTATSGSALTYDWELQEEVWGGCFGYKKLSDTVYDYAVTDRGSKLEIDGQYFYRAFDESDITKYDDVTYADIRCKVTLMPSNQTVTSEACSYSNGHFANTSKYVVDGTQHYFACYDPTCTIKKNQAAHSDTNKDGVCDVCKQSGLPVITKQPEAVSVGARDSFSYSINATGSNLTYKWYREDSGGTKRLVSSTDGSVTGQNTASFTFDPTKVSFDYGSCGLNGQKFYCVVSNEYGTVESEKALLTVNHSIFYNKSYKWDAETHEFSCYCGEKIIGNHTFDDGKITVEPTCTEEGEKTYTCKECSYPRKETVEAKGHDFANKLSKPATLTENGLIELTCKECGFVTSSSEILKASGVRISAASFVYNGKVQKPILTVKDSKGNTIATKYYTATWSNASSKAVGTYTVKVTFKGNYSGTKTLTYKILPQQVTGLKASTVKKDSIKLTWTKVTGAKYYKVEQSTDGKTWKTIKTVDTNSYTVSKLKAGTKYQFRVTALDSTKKLAGKVSAVLKTGTLTAAPTVTLKSSKSKTATASWKKVTGASKYVVYKSTDGKKWTKVTTTDKLTYNLTKLSGGKKIYVKVTAVNAYSKESAASAVKNVTVKK